MSLSTVKVYIHIALLLLICSSATAFTTDPTAWVAFLDEARAKLAALSVEEQPEAAVDLWRRMEQGFPLAADWMLQDAPDDPLWTAAPAGGREQWRAQADILGKTLAELLLDTAPQRWGRMLERVVAGLDTESTSWSEALTHHESMTEPALAAVYLQACEARRAKRLKPLLTKGPTQIVFARHFNMGASHYAYTEALSDAQNERHFVPGSALTLLRMAGTRAVAETLIDDPDGVIRDVDVSWDGTRILFAWKKSDREDDYSLYEMEAATGAIRQITDALGHADYEAVYLPDDSLLFNSTRCVQIVDCWWTEVSNLYTCDGDGRYLRRLSFDQVHTNYPTVTDDGRVIYTRWDYNDRGQLYPQGLFEMFPDGTGQQAFYGNNSWFPTTILHARSIPGTQQILAIFTGHHSWQAGKLGLLDPARGREENEGAQLAAPLRDTPAERIDHYGQEGDLFKYPYPLDDRHFLVSYAPRGWEKRGLKPQMGDPSFGLYFMDLDGHRELLYRDIEAGIPVGRMALLTARPRPMTRPSTVDYSKDFGVYYVQDVYSGQGLDGVPRGVVRSLRVVALEYRAAGIGDNRNQGPAGNALVSTPVSVANGSWDVKKPLGRARVYEDGSAMFSVPARTPVYFQALDEHGHAVQSMRSWSTLQPGATMSCVGCHDHKNSVPPPGEGMTQAMHAGVQPLDPVYGPAEGFSFPRKVQPILDRHCIQCHRGGHNTDTLVTASHVHRHDTVTALTDGHAPLHSNDQTIPRFTWWNRRGTLEWIELTFESPRSVAELHVYWFDDRPRACRIPASWRLLHEADGEWREATGVDHYGVVRDAYNTVAFDPVKTTGLRIEAQLKDGFSGGILDARVMFTTDHEDRDAMAAFSLLETPRPDPQAKRVWSDAYLQLTNGGPDAGWTRWISAQSVPPMLPPYHTGATRSPLIKLLAEGHHEVALSEEEMARLACWIDLAVPFCGAYTEANAWDEEDAAKYAHFLQKRRDMEAVEAGNIQAYLNEVQNK